MLFDAKDALIRISKLRHDGKLDASITDYADKKIYDVVLKTDDGFEKRYYLKYEGLNPVDLIFFLEDTVENFWLLHEEWLSKKELNI